MLRVLRAASTAALTGLLGLAPAVGVAGTAGAVPTADRHAAVVSWGDGGGLEVSVGSDSPIAPGSPIARYSTVNSCTHDSYMLRSWMQRFEQEGGGTLTLLPGTYTLPMTVYVPSNTTIVLSSGTTLLKTTRTCTSRVSASSSMFMLVNPSQGRVRDAVGGYDGAHDISILGAGDGTSVIDLNRRRNALGIIAGHNQRVLVQGIRFQNMNNNHFIEMDANADSVIADNEFLRATASTRRSAEAINLDTPDWLTHGFSAIWSNHDGTANLRVTIAGNVFADMMRGVGTHNFTGGQYHTGIVVRDNVFRNMRNDAMRVMNWKDSAIVGNQFDEVWCRSRGNKCRGILASGAVNVTVRDNVFSHMARAMQFFPWRNADEAAVYGITYNELTDDNLLDLANNYAGPGLGRAEAIVNPQFGVFSHPLRIRFTS